MQKTCVGARKADPGIHTGKEKAMGEYDDKVLDAFLEQQSQLFDQPVAETREEAEDFLTDLMAVVVGSAREVREYFEEEGLDIEGLEGDALLEAAEVFEVGDGRYLIVEG